MRDSLPTMCALISYLSLDYGVNIHGAKGAAVHVRSICRALAELGHRVLLQAARASGERATDLPGSVALAVLDPPRDLQRMVRSLREVYGPGLTAPPEFRQWAINLQALATLRQAWTDVRPDAVIERSSLMGVAGLRVAQELGIPHALEVNAILSDEAHAHRGLADVATARACEDELFAGTDHIFAVSEALREALAARGVAPRKIHVLPNAFDDHLFGPRDGRTARDLLGVASRVCIGMMGSMRSWHGVRTLLEAFRRVAAVRPDTSLLLIGQGPESGAIESFQQEHPGLRVLATGPVSHDSVPNLLAACDIVCAPYEAASSFYFSPMKLFEYLAMAKPVVASSQGQIETLITDGETGLLFPPGDVEALAACLLRLCGDESLRGRLGRAGRERVQGRTWRANAKSLMQIALGVPL